MVWDIPKWDNPGQSPPEQKKTDGWAVGDKPPADWLNWFMNKTSENLTEAKTGIETNTAHLADKASQLSLDNHTSLKISEENVHGMRVVDGKLEYFDGLEWKRVSGDGYPVGNVSEFTARADDKMVTLSWNDPEDVTIVDSNGSVITIARWKGTKILRKTGSYPANESDGVLVVDNGIKNQYSVSGFVDTGLVNETTYYYAAFPYTEDVFTVDEANRVSAVPTPIKIYGVAIDESNSNPETSVTYTDDAIGFSPMRGNNGAFSFGSWQGVFEDLGIKPCLLKNGVVQYYLNPDDYTKKADGTTADITTGNDGDVMIEFPKIYWKMWKVGAIQYAQYSDKPFSGADCPAHKVGANTKDMIYLPAYMGSTLSSKLRSLSGKTPTVNKTIGVFRTEARANGAGYQQMPYYSLLMLQVLYTVWFKNLDSQTALGRGYVDGNAAAIGTGGTNAKGMFFGEGTGKQQNKFCGIEDFFGNVYYWIDGFFSNTNRDMLISNQSVFNDTGAGYENIGVGASANIAGYVSSIQGETKTGFVTKVVSGSATTHYSDSGSLSGGCLPLFGGHWANGSNSGAFHLSVNSSASSANSTLTARLCFLGS